VDALRSYVRAVFRSTVGRVRVARPAWRDYVIQIEVEGPPAHDPAFVAAIRRDVIARIVTGGFGDAAVLTRWEVSILAGDTEDGRPRQQLVVVPSWSDVLEAEYGPDRRAWPVGV